VKQSHEHPVFEYKITKVESSRKAKRYNDGEAMLENLIFRKLPAVAAIAFLSTAGAQKPVVDDSVWIVELEDAPTVEFDGNASESVTAGSANAGKALAPTAPAVTGASKLRPDAPAVRAYVAYLDDQRGAFLDRVRTELGMQIRPRFVYRHLRNGFAASMTAADARRLAALPGVRSVRPDIIQYVQTDAGPGWIGAPDLWSGATGAPDPTRGEGTVLGVIDTGVNWDSIFFDVEQFDAPVTNPRGEFFGLCNSTTLDIPCNDKLIGVYDFTDEGTDGFDPDGHGSHVASTAVGLSLSLELDFGTGPIAFQPSGVAPRASLITYKACQAPDDDDSPGNFQCPGSATAAALEKAIENEVDVVNFSIGGDPFDPWSQGGNQRLFLNLRDAGIVPVVSAGNSGPQESTVASPANVPWVVAVANASHGRILANRLVDVSGGPFSLGQLVGEGTTDGTELLPIVHARDFGNALCGTGQPELGPSCGDNTGASSPFEPNTFDGQIVVCDRGEFGRVEKGKNVQLAGAAGMILANTQAQGESTTSDRHCLPATHVGASDGDRLRDWLASGSDQRGRLTGTERFVDAQAAGRLSNASSRGPAVGAPDVMKPNVTAPGTNILAAGTDINETGDGPTPDAANQVLFLTGTSMASPHVAGAALLLRSANPDWGVDEVISALETTADAGIVRNGNDAEARAIDRGAGGVQVDRAAQIGLYLPITRTAFLAANPRVGGDPGSLNLSGVFSDNCVGSCSFERTVRSLRSGTWDVSVDGNGEDIGIEVSPDTFSLQEGEIETLEIEIMPGTTGNLGWSGGSVVLTPREAGASVQRLPVAANLAASSQTTRGRANFEVANVPETDELVIRTSGLRLPAEMELQLEPDPTRNDPFDDSAGVHTELVEVPAHAFSLTVETFDSQADDVDLFVGRDDNGDGAAQQSEARCESISLDDLEKCLVEFPDSGTWWVVVQNWAPSAPGATDTVPFEYLLLSEEADPSLVAMAPGAHTGGALEVQVFWDQPRMLRDQTWKAAVGIASSPDSTADIDVVEFDVVRTGVNTPADTALFEGQAQTVVLPPGAVHDLLFIDIPDGMESLELNVEGDLSDVTIRRRGFGELAQAVPRTPPAPAEVLVQATSDGDRWVAQLAAPAEGRYFVVLENNSSAESSAVVTASVVQPPQIGTFPQAGMETMSGRGLWSPEARQINQGVDLQAGGGGRFAVWYTYEEDGTPTFYITDTVPTDGLFFQAPLFRATSNDERLTLKTVGEVQITPIDSNRFMYAWRLNGNHGAEMFDPVSVGGATCPTIPEVGPEPVPLLGHWFSPDTTAGGVTLLITGSSEAWVRYYYDDLNEPRWIIADDELVPTLPGGNLMEVVDFRGFCSYCDEVEITREVVGTLERQFIDETTVREVSDFVAGAPLEASVNIDRQITRLSNPVTCPTSDNSQ